MIYAFLLCNMHKKKVHTIYFKKECTRPTARNKNERRQPISLFGGLCGLLDTSLLWGLQDGMCFVATWILSPFLGSPRRQGLCSHFAHIWTPKTARVMQPF